MGLRNGFHAVDISSSCEFSCRMKDQTTQILNCIKSDLLISKYELSNLHTMTIDRHLLTAGNPGPPSPKIHTHVSLVKGMRNKNQN